MAKRFVCSTTEPIVLTKAGKVRGFILDGTYTFHGIQYAKAERFQMPADVEAWEGVKDALSYGYVSPLLKQEVPQGEIMVPHRYWPMDEDCQNLNIWTQSLSPNVKKPVIVWLHGGGFTSGSAIEHISYEGENMSKFGDAVVVSVNHRLNILGYLDLSPFGRKYANSGNAGNADLVAALRWIRENIANFGGDPDNVTIFGQSGGGGKVVSLLQTPSADGLFHKGIIQSGIADFGPRPKGDGMQIINALLKELGFGEGDAEKLETVPYYRMAAAYLKISPVIAAQGVYVGCNPIPNEFFTGDPMEFGLTGHARTIPLLIGSVLAEFAFMPCIPDKYELSEAEITPLIQKKYGDSSSQLIALFKKAYPDKNLTDLLYLDSFFRQATKEFIEKRSVYPEAPVFSYLFAFDFPYEGGKPAWHCSEIPFVFHNTDKVPVCNLPGVTDKLQDQIFGAWINFARNGNPNHPGLPNWTACKPGDEMTMIFDRNCETRNNFDNELMDLHKKVAPGFKRGGNEVMIH